ncbi:MAG: ParB/RepB/Spo0J family partition protein [Candidatus Pacebacteria bacterium]|nr:ParB/RepB/Spo0J family partition protein [Candidatus Paceibacterota bacterium]
MVNNGLGRGLSSLISSNNQSANNKSKETNQEALPTGDFSSDKDRIFNLDPSLIMANSDQPREYFNDEHLNELMNSIKEHGILQPLVVIKKDDKFELIAGERRLRAAKLSNFKTVPAIIRSVDKQEKLELALIENLQRENLSPLETAVAYQKLIDEFGLTQDKVSKKVGKSRPSVANTLRLLSLPTEIKRALTSRKITEAHAKEILSLKNEKDQLNLFKKIIQHGLSVKATSEVNKAFQRSSGNKTSKNDVKDREREEALRKFFNSQTKIRRKKNGGEIIINFFDDDGLEEIITKLK